MRFFLLVIIALSPSCTCVRAQGFAWSFNAEMRGANAVPPSDGPIYGTARLGFSQPGLLSVNVPLAWAAENDVVEIYRSTSSAELGTLLFRIPALAPLSPDFETPPGYEFSTFDSPISISAEQMADLDAGYWWVNVRAITTGRGEARGQVLAIPEPNASVLLISAAVFFVICKRRNLARWRIHRIGGVGH